MTGRFGTPSSGDRDLGQTGIVVAGVGSALDHALAALVDATGHSAEIVPIALLGQHRPRVLLFTDDTVLHRIRALTRGWVTTRLVGLVAPTLSSRTRGVTWLGGQHPVADLRRILHDAIGAPHPGHGGARVELSVRELEVMEVYARGATAPETAGRLQIAESTVKTHYGRVAGKYRQAGRPVANRAELLVELMRDGWIPRPGDDAPDDDSPGGGTGPRLVG
ncbi:MAG: helix-turn-helix transcriptional regulator [Gordonia sp. (in: high G+C Gram-positive bacteria)]